MKKRVFPMEKRISNAIAAIVTAMNVFTRATPLISYSSPTLLLLALVLSGCAGNSDDNTNQIEVKNGNSKINIAIPEQISSAALADSEV
jgi:hypothetical protein